MSLLRDLLRRLRGEPPPPVGAARPTPPRESAESPYRRPAEVPARAWPGPLHSLEGYEIVGTLESDGELYAKHLVVSPAAPERRASVSCFGTRGLDDQLFLVLVDEVRALKRLDHPRIAAHLIRRPLGNLAAIFQHHQLFTGAHHQPHIVLNQQQGDPARPDSTDQANQRLGFLFVHPARRLIQNQQARLSRQGAGNFQPALIAISQILRDG